MVKTPQFVKHNALFVSGEYDRPWYAFQVSNANTVQTLRVGDVCNFTFPGAWGSMPLVGRTAVAYATGLGSPNTTTTLKKRGLTAGVVWNSDIGPSERGIVAAMGLLPTRVWGPVAKGNYLALSTNQPGHLEVFSADLMTMSYEGWENFCTTVGIDLEDAPPRFCGQAYTANTTGSGIIRALWWPWRY